MKLQDSERDALRNSAILLKFLAESPKTAPNEVVSPLLAAWDAAENDQWSPQIATDFWIAYSKLCDLVKPVTIDTLSMLQAPTMNWWTRLWNSGRSKAQIHARRYLSVLMLLLICSVVFGFIANTTTKLSQEIENLITEGDQVASQVNLLMSGINVDLNALNTEVDSLQLNLDDKRIPKEIKDKIEDLRAKLQTLYRVGDQLQSKVGAISHATMFMFGPLKDYPQGDLSRLPVLDNGFDNVRDYYQTRRKIRDAQQNVALLNGIYNALVPVLLGAVGAATYVVRQSSDEIKDSTFASSSPTRHVVRIALGSLAGLIIGLGGFDNQLNLSSAALSFIAGYSIEPVFSTFDSIAEKFKRT